jgi:hypothetical protein
MFHSHYTDTTLHSCMASQGGCDLFRITTAPHQTRKASQV